MKQHKWHKEIKHWADGGEVEILYTEGAGSKSDWMIVDSHVDWDFKNCEYRIKPQPIITDYYIWANHKGEVRFCHPDKLCETPIEYKYIGKIKLEESDK
jgi:hypothetical protein